MENKGKKRFSRRDILIGGMMIAAILADKLITLPRAQIDKNLLFETDEPTWNGVTWWPDSTHISWITKDKLMIVDLKNGERSEKKLGNFIANMDTMARSGTRLASIDYLPDIQIVVQDVHNGHILWTYKDPQFSRDRLYSINAISWSPDGTRFAFIFRRDDLSDNHTDSVVQVRDAQSWKVIWEYKERTARGFDPYDIDWSPDGTLLVAVHFDMAQYLDASDGHLLYSLPYSRTWSADGRLIASALTDPPEQEMIQVIAWQARTGKKLFQTEIGYDDLDDPRIAWSPDGTRLALRWGQQIQVWSVQTTKLLFTCQHVKGTVYALSWSPDGRYIVARNNPNQADNSQMSAKLQFWNAQNGKALFVYDAPRMPTGYGKPAHMDWSPDSRFLAIDNKKDWSCHYNILMGGTDCSFDNDVIQVFQVI